MSGSRLLISADIEKAKEHILNELSNSNIKTFFKDDFLLEDAKEVTREAYIAESKEKFLILAAKSYNIYAQNSLLKILEDSPRNISFILIAPSKTVFLPTIRSRLVTQTLKNEKKDFVIELSFKNLDLEDIYLFVKEHQRVSKPLLKEIVQVILKKAVNEEGINLSEKELDIFQTALHLCELNGRANFILSTVLLVLLKKSA